MAVTTYDSKLEAALQRAQEIQGQGPEWLQSLRKKALEAHQAAGIPTPKNEEWKYTPLREVAEKSFVAAEPGPALFDKEMPFVAEGSVRIVMVNGRLDRNLSEIPNVKGLKAISLHDAIDQHEDVVKEYLGQIARMEEHTFAALNTAIFEDGLFLHFEKGAMIEPLIEIVHISSGENQIIAPRTLILAEENSSAKMVEYYVTEGEGQNLNLPVTEVYTSKHSNIEHVRVQDEAESEFHIALWEIQQEGDCEYRSYNIAFGGKLARTDQNFWMGGEHIETRLDGVVVARNEQLIDNHTNLDHAKPNCNSYEVYKQIIDDKAQVVFNGKIYVHKDAQKTDAEQTNQALLLSPNATIDSKPQLEIFADDVKCTHGATVGQIEKLPKFYMMSRGIPEETSEGLLVYAFAAEVIELITIEPLKERLEKRLYEKLN